MSLRRGLSKLGVLFRRRKPVDDLAEEIRSHLEMEEQENLEGGMPPEEAHYAALRRFGNVTLAQERSREMWGWKWVRDALAGHSLRPAHAGEESRLHGRRRHHAGARHRGKHRDLQPNERRNAPRVASPEPSTISAVWNGKCRRDH